MKRIFLGAVTALTALAIGTPAYAESAPARPDLRVTAELSLLGAPPAEVGGGMWVTLTVTNAGDATARNVHATEAASHNIDWSRSAPDLTGLDPFRLAPGESRSWTLNGSFANESDVEGQAWAAYTFATRGEKNPADNSARVDTEVVFGTADLRFYAYHGDDLVPGVGASFVYVKDGVEKTWRTIHTCDSGWISVQVPGGRYTIRFTAPEGYRIREGWEEMDLRMEPGARISLDTQLELAGTEVPPPAGSTDPECTTTTTTETTAATTTAR